MRAASYRCGLCRKDLASASYAQRVAHVKKCARSAPPVAPCVPPPVASDAPSGCVSAWLDALGLSRYAASFAREEVDAMELVAALTDHDLVTLGVHSLGARRRILTAACALPAPAAFGALADDLRKPDRPPPAHGRVPKRPKPGQGRVGGGGDAFAAWRSGGGGGRAASPPRPAPARVPGRALVEIGNSALGMGRAGGGGEAKRGREVPSLWRYAGA